MIISLVFLTLACGSDRYFIKDGVDLSRYRKVAILAKPGADIDAKTGQAVAGELISIRLLKKKYEVIEYFARKELFQELKLNMSGLYNADPAELGKLKSFNALLLVSFPRYKVFTWRTGAAGYNVLGTGMNMRGKEAAKTEVSVSVRLVSVADGVVLYACSADSILQGSRLSEAAKRAVDQCIKPIPEIRGP